jgi:enoyl-CoA hydratase
MDGVEPIVATASGVQLEKPAAFVARIVIDAPPTNALGLALRRQFLTHLDAIERDDAIRVLIITGSGPGFCSGDDLKEREQALSNREDPATAFGALVARIEQQRIAVIAAVNGWAIGGGLELALGCDIRIASTDARFVCAAVNVGLIASAWRLPRLIGIARAKHMLLSGLPFEAAEAERFGLITALLAPDALQTAALALAERIASRAPLSVEAAKRIAGAALDLDQVHATQAIQREFESLIVSEDHAEALAAFREKRAPVFHRR